VNTRADDDQRKARELYALTDQLQVQLRVLEETAAPVDVRVALQPTTDVEALALQVMLEASRAADEDLRAVLDQMRAVSTARKRLRQKPRPAVASEIDLDTVLQLVATLYAKQLDDSLSELSEMDQLRLQMAMDRLSKMMSTLSNILKKMSDTASQITQNLK
jgi:hypothetical protein